MKHFVPFWTKAVIDKSTCNVSIMLTEKNGGSIHKKKKKKPITGETKRFFLYVSIFSYCFI